MLYIYIRLKKINISGCGGTGRRIGLKIRWPQGRTGSNPVTPTTEALTRITTKLPPAPEPDLYG